MVRLPTCECGVCGVVPVDSPTCHVIALQRLAFCGAGWWWHGQRVLVSSPSSMQGSRLLRCNLDGLELMHCCCSRSLGHLSFEALWLSPASCVFIP